MSKNDKWIFHKVCKTCGKLCGVFRRDFLGVTQKEVAEDIGYSKENIASFEQGRNDNNVIFLWYLKHGLLEHYTIEELIGWWDND